MSGLTIVDWGKFVAKQKCGQPATASMQTQLLFYILFSLYTFKYEKRLIDLITKPAKYLKLPFLEFHLPDISSLDS